MLLERLARDLKFDLQLYVTADQQFGHAQLDTDGHEHWTGLVGDRVPGRLEWSGLVVLVPDRISAGGSLLDRAGRAAVW